MDPVLQATHTVPIVFNKFTDPVGAGYVESMAQPAAMRPALFNSSIR
jgi:ABC-type uncharacterized transport system substrate-binding protein